MTADKRYGRLRDGIRKIWRFVSDEVWDVELSSLSVLRRLGVKSIRVVALVMKGFKEDQCPLHASALTYTTLMSIVPILAVSLAVARGFQAGDGAEKYFKDAAYRLFQVQPVATNVVETVAVESEAGVTNAVAVTNAVGLTDVAGVETMQEGGLSAGQIDQVVEQLFSWIDNVNFTALGGIGLVILLVTVVLVLGRVEFSFNRVWGVTAARPFHRKVFDYLGFLIVLPILVIGASSLQAVEIAARFSDDGVGQIIRDVLGSGLLKRVVILVLTTATFTFIIMFVPNTRVRTRPGMIGGFIAAILFLLLLFAVKWVQIGIVTRLKIYATFAVVPILLFWVSMSWKILLFGAEVAFAVQNCATYRMETRAHTASMRAKLILALSVVSETAKAVLGNAPSFDVSVYAREKKVPVRLLNEVVDLLVRQGLLGELSERPGQFVLLKSPEKLKASYVINCLLTSGARPRELGLESLGAEFEDLLNKADAAVDSGLESATIRDLG